MSVPCPAASAAAALEPAMTIADAKAAVVTTTPAVSAAWFIMDG